MYWCDSTPVAQRSQAIENDLQKNLRREAQRPRQVGVKRPEMPDLKAIGLVFAAAGQLVAKASSQFVLLGSNRFGQPLTKRFSDGVLVAQ